MGTGDLIPALGEGGYSNITMLVETLRTLIFLLLQHKTGKKTPPLLLTHKAGKKFIFLSLVITCQKLKQAQ